MVSFKGSVIDVAKLQSNLDKSEKVRRATDVKFIELQIICSQDGVSEERRLAVGAITGHCNQEDQA